MEFIAPDIGFWALLPPALVAIGAMTALLRGVLAPEAGPRPLVIGQVSLAAAFIATLLAGFGGSGDSFAGMLRLDPITELLWLLFLGGTATVLLMADERLRVDGRPHVEAQVLLLFACCGMMLMAAGGHLVLLFVGLETMSIALYVLAGLAGAREPKSNEAALKYLLLGAFATGFLVYGLAFVYGSCGTLRIAEIGAKIVAGRADGAFLAVGLAMVTVGLGFKVALVPFHMWAPDVYEGAPTTVTAFMAVGPKIAGFAAMIRVFGEAAGEAQMAWAPLLAGLAAVTMLVGNLFALAQTNVKRLLAFSSVAHAGYLAVGIVAGGPLGVQAVLFYGLAYTFVTLGAFAVVGHVAGDDEKLALGDYAGLARRSPLAAALMALFLVSLAGIPPAAGFLGKWLVFAAAVEAGWTWLAVVGVLCALLSVYYYLRIVVLMYFEEPADTTPLPLSPTTRLVLWITGAMTVLLSFPIGLIFVQLTGRAAG